MMGKVRDPERTLSESTIFSDPIRNYCGI